MDRLRIGIIGCGYWGPNLIRNFSSLPAHPGGGGLRRQPGAAGGGRPGLPAREAGRVARRTARPEADAVAIATPGLDPLPAGQAVPGGRAARDGREAADGHRPGGPGAGRPGRPARPGPDGRPHVPVQQRRPEGSRSSSTRASWATCTTWTASGSTSGCSSATSTSSGTSPRTTCRSSTTSSAATPGASRPGAAPRRPGHRGHRLRQRGLRRPDDGQLPRQLAVPGQGPADDLRRVEEEPHLQRAEHDRAGQGLRPRDRLRRPTDRRSGSGSMVELPHRATSGARTSSRARPCRRRSPTSPSASATGKTPISDGRLGLRVVRLLEAATRSIRAQGGRVVLAAGDRRAGAPAGFRRAAGPAGRPYSFSRRSDHLPGARGDGPTAAKPPIDGDLHLAHAGPVARSGNRHPDGGGCDD